MASVIVNRDVVAQIIDGILDKEKPYFREIAFEYAKDAFDNVKEDVLNKFDEHPVTVEIAEGPDAESYILPFGNLYTFLGFKEDSHPIEHLRDFLDEYITLNSNGTYNSRYKKYYFRVDIPSEEELEYTLNEDIANWLGESWPAAIENGISNLGYYLYVQGEQLKGSRSGPALQLHNEIKGREGFEFPGTPYLSEIFKYLSKQLDTSKV